MGYKMEAGEELDYFTCHCFSFLSTDRDISRNPFQALIVMPRNRGYYFTAVESGFEYPCRRSCPTLWLECDRAAFCLWALKQNQAH